MRRLQAPDGAKERFRLFKGSVLPHLAGLVMFDPRFPRFHRGLLSDALPALKKDEAIPFSDNKKRGVIFTPRFEF
jgi:hypothetical protein